MEIWLDTTDSKRIELAARLGILHGVTTNPKIASESSLDLEPMLEGLLELQPGPVAVQVVSEEAQAMIEEAQALRRISSRLVIKVPVTVAGLEAIHKLTKAGVPCLGTVIFTPIQGLLAAKAGARYLAPYLGRIRDAGGDPLLVCQQIIAMLQAYDLPTKLMGASIRDQSDLLHCAEERIDAITVSPKVFDQLTTDDPSTVEQCRIFAELALQA